MINYKTFKMFYLILISNLITLFQLKPIPEAIPRKLDIGICSMQGHRDSMEDEHQIILNWGNLGITYAAVFDGHGGSEVAIYLKENLHKKILKIFQQTKNLKESIEKGCLQINEEILAKQEPENSNPDDRAVRRPRSFGTIGSCAILVFIDENKVIIANIGDSRAVINNNGRVIKLSTDHKPNVPAEKTRIESAGGKVWESKCGTISRLFYYMGLAVSRAFGDLAYKELITAKPEIIECNFCGKDILILACDGLWDVMSNEEAVELASKFSNMQESADKLVKEAIENKSSSDNVTVIAIKPTDPHLWVYYTRKP